MKTTIVKLATVLLMLTAGRTTFATTMVNTSVSTELTWIKNFYKIEVHGNVRLHLLAGEKNRVQMSGRYYNHNALLQVEKGVLRITCYRTQRLDVWVTAVDLRALAAYDNVLVNTEGMFNSLDLSIELFDNAKADLNLDCCFSSIKLNDRSLANVSGTAIESEQAVNYASTLNATNFTAPQMLTKRMDPEQQTSVAYEVAAETDDLFNSFRGVKDQQHF